MRHTSLHCLAVAWLKHEYCNPDLHGFPFEGNDIDSVLTTIDFFESERSTVTDGEGVDVFLGE